jgi:hypothetical protein
MNTFVVTKNPTFTTDVEVYEPTADGHEKKVLRTAFRVLANADATGFDTSTYEGTQAYLQAIVIGFENLVDEDGKEMACSDALRNDLMDMPYIQNALVTAYTKALLGAKRGN